MQIKNINNQKIGKGREKIIQLQLIFPENFAISRAIYTPRSNITKRPRDKIDGRMKHDVTQQSTR